MAIIINGGGGGIGGAGFSLGPQQNVFTGATRAAAETARDTYAGANPDWLAQYNADVNLNIRLEFTESSEEKVVYQTRNEAGSEWLDNQSFQAIKGDKGDTGNTGAKGDDGVVQSIVAGDNVTVDSSDPANPIVSSKIDGKFQKLAPAGFGDYNNDNWYDLLGTSKYEMTATVAELSNSPINDFSFDTDPSTSYLLTGINVIFTIDAVEYRRTTVTCVRGSRTETFVKEASKAEWNTGKWMYQNGVIIENPSVSGSNTLTQSGTLNFKSGIKAYFQAGDVVDISSTSFLANPQDIQDFKVGDNKFELSNADFTGTISYLSDTFNSDDLFHLNLDPSDVPEFYYVTITNDSSSETSLQVEIFKDSRTKLLINRGGSVIVYKKENNFEVLEIANDSTIGALPQFNIVSDNNTNTLLPTGKHITRLGVISGLPDVPEEIGRLYIEVENNLAYDTPELNRRQYYSARYTIVDHETPSFIGKVFVRAGKDKTTFQTSPIREITKAGGGGFDPSSLAPDTVPVVNSNSTELINSSITETDTNIIMTKTLIVPQESLQVGPALTVSDKGGNLGLQNKAEGYESFVAVNRIYETEAQRDEIFPDGIPKIKYEYLVPAKWVYQFPFDTETSDDNYLSFELADTDNTYIRKFRLFSEKAQSGVRIWIENLLPSGDQLVWENVSEKDFNAGKGDDLVGSGFTEIDIGLIKISTANIPFRFNIQAQSGEKLNIRGSKLDIGFGEGFYPKLFTYTQDSLDVEALDAVDTSAHRFGDFDPEFRIDTKKLLIRDKGSDRDVTAQGVFDTLITDGRPVVEYVNGVSPVCIRGIKVKHEGTWGPVQVSFNDLRTTSVVTLIDGDNTIQIDGKPLTLEANETLKVTFSGAVGSGSKTQISLLGNSEQKPYAILETTEITSHGVGRVDTLVGGNKITVDSTDPANPVVNWTPASDETSTNFAGVFESTTALLAKHPSPENGLYANVLQGNGDLPDDRYESKDGQWIGQGGIVGRIIVDGSRSLGLITGEGLKYEDDGGNAKISLSGNTDVVDLDMSQDATRTLDRTFVGKIANLIQSEQISVTAQISIVDHSNFTTGDILTITASDTYTNYFFAVYYNDSQGRQRASYPSNKIILTRTDDGWDVSLDGRFTSVILADAGQTTFSGDPITDHAQTVSGFAFVNRTGVEFITDDSGKQLLKVDIGAGGGGGGVNHSPFNEVTIIDSTTTITSATPDNMTYVYKATETSSSDFFWVNKLVADLPDGWTVNLNVDPKSLSSLDIFVDFDKKHVGEIAAGETVSIKKKDGKFEAFLVAGQPYSTELDNTYLNAFNSKWPEVPTNRYIIGDKTAAFSNTGISDLDGKRGMMIVAVFNSHSVYNTHPIVHHIYTVVSDDATINGRIFTRTVQNRLDLLNLHFTELGAKGGSNELGFNVDHANAGEVIVSGGSNHDVVAIDGSDNLVLGSRSDSVKTLHLATGDTEIGVYRKDANTGVEIVDRVVMASELDQFEGVDNFWIEGAKTDGQILKGDHPEKGEMFSGPDDFFMWKYSDYTYMMPLAFVIHQSTVPTQAGTLAYNPQVKRFTLNASSASASVTSLGWTIGGGTGGADGEDTVPVSYVDLLTSASGLAAGTYPLTNAKSPDLFTFQWSSSQADTLTIPLAIVPDKGEFVVGGTSDRIKIIHSDAGYTLSVSSSVSDLGFIGHTVGYNQGSTVINVDKGRNKRTYYLREEAYTITEDDIQHDLIIQAEPFVKDGDGFYSTTVTFPSIDVFTKYYYIPQVNENDKNTLPHIENLNIQCWLDPEETNKDTEHRLYLKSTGDSVAWGTSTLIGDNAGCFIHRPANDTSRNDFISFNFMHIHVGGSSTGPMMGYTAQSADEDNVFSLGVTPPAPPATPTIPELKYINLDSSYHNLNNTAWGTVLADNVPEQDIGYFYMVGKGNSFTNLPSSLVLTADADYSMATEVTKGEDGGFAQRLSIVSPTDTNANNRTIQRAGLDFESGKEAWAEVMLRRDAVVYKSDIAEVDDETFSVIATGDNMTGEVVDGVLTLNAEGGIPTDPSFDVVTTRILKVHEGPDNSDKFTEWSVDGNFNTEVHAVGDTHYYAKEKDSGDLNEAYQVYEDGKVEFKNGAEFTNDTRIDHEQDYGLVLQGDAIYGKDKDGYEHFFVERNNFNVKSKVIQNVRDGVAEDDAVNVSQLNALEAQITTLTQLIVQQAEHIHSLEESNGIAFGDFDIFSSQPNEVRVDMHKLNGDTVSKTIQLGNAPPHVDPTPPDPQDFNVYYGWDINSRALIQPEDILNYESTDERSATLDMQAENLLTTEFSLTRDDNSVYKYMYVAYPKDVVDPNPYRVEYSGFVADWLRREVTIDNMTYIVLITEYPNIAESFTIKLHN